ncbi:SDR family oxidoreductase [Aquibium sp. A9E412]|uniref:SDR family NAD(P)-dependent oxidoreductase n=1 Tax=Aquibium sp. A9E412 TaxID=2976767 RepID=UPI0025B1A58E|nr:SDR family oxidoreductase [Aquibium sp. A9E412]MDN2564608.1 SDR family oxidoreductase [Aquibium sp. A9E412]
MIRFDDRTAIVTGAGRGIGYAYAEILAARGARVVVHDIGAGPDGTSRDASVAAAAARRLRARGHAVRAASGPIDSRAGCRALVEETVSAFGGLDIVIHNAGWVGYQRIEELAPDFLARMTRLGVETPLWLAQAGWPVMKGQGYGRILLTTSDRALFPEHAQAGLAAYAAAKSATLGIMNVLAHEGAPHGIRVNAISPVAKTRMWGVQGDVDELRPDAVAPGAAFLVSQACRASAWMLRASNGQFRAFKPCEASGVDYPRDLGAVTAESPEAVAAAWDAIAGDAPQAE